MNARSAVSLIQEYDFQEAFQIALDNDQIDVARQIVAIEKRLFGAYSNYMMPTTQFPICSNSLRLDLYNHCPFGCRYCFAGHSGKEIVVGDSMSAISSNLEACFSGEQMSGKHKSFAAMVRQGWPIHIGGHWMYDTYKFTHEDEDGNKHFRVIAVD
jgi:hypothetical protein